MKIIILTMILLSAGISLSQDNNVDINGNIFHGKATEITPPDVDRMPQIYDETILFQNGKLECETFKKYRAGESAYSSYVDNRRAIAMEVICFRTSSSGIINGQPAVINFAGNIIGRQKLNGTITIIYNDNSETNFIIEASSE